MYIEAAIAGHRNVYDFGPVFRAEKSKTRRHLNELWMMDAETAFCDNDNNCLEQKGNEIYFSDKNHLSKIGSLKAVIAIEDQLTKLVNNIEAKQVFSYLQNNQIAKHESSLLNFKGWYKPEAKHRWGKGKQAEISFNIKDKKQFKGVIEIEAGIFKKQEVSLFLNGKAVGSKIASGWNNNFIFNFNPSLLNDGRNKITFKYPNSLPVGTENDNRILAFAFKSIKIK